MRSALPQPEQTAFLRDPLSSDAVGHRNSSKARHLAHDARNWLTVLRVYCGMLRNSDTVTGRGRKWVEELSSAIERGHELVVSLLDSMENSPGPQPFSRSAALPSGPLGPLDLSAAVERRVPLLRRMAGNFIEVTVKTVAHAETTIGEPEFERILLNLVRNAMDAMPHGGKLKIALQHGRPSSLPAGRRSLVLRVSDTGNGINAEFLPHIFDSGFSTKLTSADPPPGRGFGLAIVRKLTLGAGGAVHVHSRIGHGTSFAVELPLLSPPHPSKPSRATSSQPRLAVVSQMPKPKTGRRAPRNNSGANRKGTRVPC